MFATWHYIARKYSSFVYKPHVSFNFVAQSQDVEDTNIIQVGFYQYLDVGLWYIFIYNDSPSSQMVDFQAIAQGILLKCDFMAWRPRMTDVIWFSPLHFYFFTLRPKFISSKVTPSVNIV